MCYGVKARTEMSLRMARSRGDAATAERLRQLLEPPEVFDLHFANAFDHPRLVLFTDTAPREPGLFTWGLVPGWVKGDAQRVELWNRTLNARGETIFDKPAFRAAAKHRRAIVYVEGFYEHFHFGKKAYPHFIRLKDREAFALAALWEEWTDRESNMLWRTFSIVTTEANALMRRIHNKPGSEGPRMPLILAEGEEEQWLAPLHSTHGEAALKALIKPFPEEAMRAWSVKPLLGKEGKGNRAGASDEFDYPELALAGPLAHGG